MPRTKEANQKILDERKNQLIKTAINVFSIQDYKNTKIDDITKTLNISHGLFYHYFKNKSDLIKQILIYANEHLIQKFKILAEKYSGVVFLEKFFTLYLKLVKDKENALLFHFVSNVVADITDAYKKEKTPAFDLFFRNAFPKNLVQLSHDGKLIQSIENTIKIIYILLDGICDLVIEDQPQRITLTAQAILNTIIKQEDYTK